MWHYTAFLVHVENIFDEKYVNVTDIKLREVFVLFGNVNYFESHELFDFILFERFFI